MVCIAASHCLKMRADRFANLSSRASPDQSTNTLLHSDFIQNFQKSKKQKQKQKKTQKKSNQLWLSVRVYVLGAGGDLGSNNPWSFTCWICLLSFHMWEHQKALINCFSGWTWTWGEWANLSSKWGSAADWLWGGFQVVYSWVQNENHAILGLFLLIVIFFQNKKNFTYVYMVVIKSIKLKYKIIHHKQWKCPFISYPHQPYQSCPPHPTL